MKELTMAEVQQSELLILKKISEICEKLNIRYYITCGTLIGAVRHKGFIPWDDDLDIMMPRKDYDKLLNYLIKNKESVFPLKAVYVWHKQKYMYAMARITDMTTVLKYSYYGAYTEDDMGTFIDIYPLDGMGNDYSNAITISRKTGYLRKWITWAHYDKHIINNNKLKNICVFMLERIAHIIGEDFFQKKLIAYTKKYDYDSSRYVGCITWHDTIYCWDRLNIEGDTKLEFEGERFRVPQKYDSFLKQLYGNYMKLPPKEERHSTHYYKAYKRGELDE